MSRIGKFKRADVADCCGLLRIVCGLLRILVYLSLAATRFVADCGGQMEVKHQAESSTVNQPSAEDR